MLDVTGHALLMLPMVRKLKNDCPSSNSSCHADDGLAVGNFNTMPNFFKRLCEIRLSCGHFLEESKSMIVVKDKDIERASNFWTENNLALIVKSGSIRLGGFVSKK